MRLSLVLKTKGTLRGMGGQDLTLPHDRDIKESKPVRLLALSAKHEVLLGGYVSSTLLSA